MKKCIKNYAVNISPDTYCKLNNYLLYYNKCKNLFYNKYQNDINAIYLPYKYEIRDALVLGIKNDTLHTNELNLLKKVPAKLQKNALTEAMTNLKSNQSNSKSRIRKAIRKNVAFSEKDIHYLNYVLKSNNLLHLINKGDVNVTLEKFDVNCKKLNSYLHRQIKKEKRKPYSKGSSYIVDSSSQILYKQTPNGLCCFLSTTKRRERVLIKLSNNIEYKGDIRIVLKNDTIELHKAITTKFNTNDNSSITGLYIDFNDLFTTQNKIYGKNFSKLLKKFTHTIHLKQKKRDDFKSMNSVAITKNNLGTKKQNSKKRKFINELNSFINKNLDQIIKEEQPSTIILKSINKYLLYNNKNDLYNIPNNHLQILNNYIISYIYKRLEYKAQLNRINIILDSSNYTAKECASCKSKNITITKGYFKCNSCMASITKASNAINDIIEHYGVN